MAETDGVPLKQIAETPGFDPVRTWGAGPFLLIRAAPSSDVAPFMFDTPDEGAVVATSKLGPGVSGRISTYLARNAVLAPVRKTRRNAFGPQVTIGRARSNDIRLSDSSVSKVHAYLLPPGGWPLQEEGGWRLRDATSTNGTHVASGSGEVLAPPAGPGLLLQPGAELRFGAVRAIFVDPEHLTQALEVAKLEWERADRRAAETGSSDTKAAPRPSDEEE